MSEQKCEKSRFLICLCLILSYCRCQDTKLRNVVANISNKAATYKNLIRIINEIFSIRLTQVPSFVGFSVVGIRQIGIHDYNDKFRFCAADINYNCLAGIILTFSRVSLYCLLNIFKKVLW